MTNEHGTPTPLKITINTGDTLSATLAATPAAPRENPRKIGLIFAHGSSNDMHHPTIKALATGLADHGYPSLRFNFPYKEAQRKSPDPAHRLIHSIERAMDCLKNETDVDKIIIAGKSLGARMAAQGTRQGDLSPAGLIFLGYPFHAPGKKDQPRKESLMALTLPLLFFQGTRDPFCHLPTFQETYDRLKAPSRLEIIENGDHGFKLPASDPRRPEAVHEQMQRVCLDWLNHLFPS